MAIDLVAFGIALLAMVDHLFVAADAIGARWWLGPLYLVIPTALLWRRRLPVAVAVAVAAPIAVQSVVTGHPSEGLELVWPVAVALYSLGVYCPSYRQVSAGVAVVVAGMAVHDLNDTQSIFHEGQASEWAWGFWLLVELAVVLLGVWVGTQRRHHQLAAERAAAEAVAALQTRAAIEAERARIAGELHDVVTHNVNVVVLQAMAASGVLDSQPERARDPLAAIEASGREALVELRRLLGMLYDGQGSTGSTAPAPGIADLPELVAGVRHAGLDADLEVAGDAGQVSSALGLVVYRIAQEALTNTLKHAPHSHAQVRVECTDDAVEVEITDTGGAANPDTVVGGGRGLAGMRERAALFGGRLVAAPRVEGGFVVWVRLPRVGGADGG